MRFHIYDIIALRSFARHDSIKNIDTIKKIKKKINETKIIETNFATIISSETLKKTSK